MSALSKISNVTASTGSNQGVVGELAKKETLSFGFPTVVGPVPGGNDSGIAQRRGFADLKSASEGDLIGPLRIQGLVNEAGPSQELEQRLQQLAQQGGPSQPVTQAQIEQRLWQLAPQEGASQPEQGGRRNLVQQVTNFFKKHTRQM